MAIFAPDHIRRQRRHAIASSSPLSIDFSVPSTTAAAAAASSSGFDALDGGADPATSAKAAITSPGTIKIVVLLVVTTVVLFSSILFVLCCYRDGDRRSRFCSCFGRKTPRSLPPRSLPPRSLPPRLPSKDGYDHDDTQPLTPRAGYREEDAQRQEGNSWTDRIRQSVWIDQPRRSSISPPRTPVMMTSVEVIPSQRSTLHRAPTGPSSPRRTAEPPLPRVQSRAPNEFRSPVRRDFAQGPPTPAKPTQPKMLAPPIVTRKPAPRVNAQQSTGPTFDQILRPPRMIREPRPSRKQGPPRDPGTRLRFADEGYAAGRVE